MRKVAALIIITLLMTITWACAKNVRFAKSSVVPAAEGTVKVNEDRNNNYKIDISIIRLADPERLQPPKKTYVAWMETNGYGTKNIGRLQSSSGFLSKTLKASLHTITAFKPRRIFITGEEDGSIQYPAGKVVLTTNDLK